MSKKYTHKSSVNKKNCVKQINRPVSISGHNKHIIDRNEQIIEGHAIKKYFKTLDHNKILCELCPNNCIILNDKVGLCCTRKNINGKLYSLVYGHPCSINVDPIEKKPLYHFIPGQGILSIGTFGCNIFCKGCQNFDITKRDASKSFRKIIYYSPEEIVMTAIKHDIRMIAYTYNEPTVFFEYMIDIAKIARKHGLKNVIVTNGYINSGPLKELCKYIDAANIDIKGINDKFYKEYSGVKLEPVLDTIKYLHTKKVWLELTNLIIPGLNDNYDNIKKLCGWIKMNVGCDVPLHFSRFYPHYNASKIPITPKKTLEDAKNIALKGGIKYVYIGNLGFLDDTYCTKCNNKIIERGSGFIKINGLDSEDTCIKCGAKLPGVFNIKP
ncbi:MAG: AmmeMemoRadiSam system radical SAM enzyme [Candidatus Woesearchaeota archaeon]